MDKWVENMDTSTGTRVAHEGIGRGQDMGMDTKHPNSGVVNLVGMADFVVVDMADFGVVESEVGRVVLGVVNVVGMALFGVVESEVGMVDLGVVNVEGMDDLGVGKHKGMEVMNHIYPLSINQSHPKKP